MKAGDKVAVYVDLDKACLRGQAKKYAGRKVFVGNGLAMLGREALYTCSAKHLRGKGVGILMVEPLYRSPSLGDMFAEGVVLQNLPVCVICMPVIFKNSSNSHCCCRAYWLDMLWIRNPEKLCWICVQVVIKNLSLRSN